MFCPPNFLDWFTMRSQTRDWASRMYLADALAVEGEDPSLAFNENVVVRTELIRLLNKTPRKQVDWEQVKFDIELISFSLMSHSCEVFDPLICTSTGKLLKAPEPVFFHPDQFFYFHLRFPLRAMAELFGIYKEYDNQRMSVKDFGDRFCCIDDDTGAIVQKNQTLSHFKRYWNDPSNPRFGISVFDSCVKPFLGYSIVWDPEKIPNSYAEIFKKLGLDFGDGQYKGGLIERNQHSIKKGKKPRAAQVEFNKRYPNGLPVGLTAEAVAAELTEDGYRVGRRTVGNYLKEQTERK